MFPRTHDTVSWAATSPTVVTNLPSGENCTFSPLVPWNGEVYLPAGDLCYFRIHSPLVFLNDLRMHPCEPVSVIGVPAGWITRQDAEQLMQSIDSVEPAAPVVSPLSSYWPFNKTSTVGNEAMFLLEGYRIGRYPPGLCSLQYFHPNRTEMRVWWEQFGKAGIPDERAAVRLVQDTDPDLYAYPSSQFPVKTIKTTRAADGWYVAFIVEGSGVPIVSARCYFAGDNRLVRQTGLVSHALMVMPQNFSAQMCG
ncbi:MAG: hypothetical protein WC391_06850 [Methanoregula sp.]